MNTTTTDKATQLLETEWKKWGEGDTQPSLKEYVELMLKFNQQTKEILEETRDWLITNGNQ